MMIITSIRHVIQRRISSEGSYVGTVLLQWNGVYKDLGDACGSPGRRKILPRLAPVQDDIRESLRSIREATEDQYRRRAG